MSQEASSTGTFPSSKQSSQSIDPKSEYPDAISLTVPSSFLILPPMAVSLGLVIGMYRGGRMARLRFLAENAHRQPRTLQGWYFYTKTRNYKIAYASALQGGKTAIALGGATTTYVFLEEYISYLRETVLGIYAPRGGSGAGFRDAVTWRSGGCVWWDGVLAGTILGGAVGLIWRLPGRLVGRCLGFGAIMGGIHSYTRVISAKLAEKIKIDQAEEIASLPVKEPPTPPTPPTPSTQTEKVAEIVPAEQIQASRMEHPFVDREVEPAPRPPSAFSDIDGLLAGEERKSQGWWDSAKSWVGRS